MRFSNMLAAAAVALIVAACTSLRTDIEPQPTPSDASADSGASPVVDSAVGDGAVADGATDAGQPADGGPRPLGAVETIASKLAQGLGVSTTTSHVYWLERGEVRGGNSDALLKRQQLGVSCAAGTNCGASLYPANGFPYYFGDTHGGPYSSDRTTCIDVTVNAARDSEINCVTAGGTVERLRQALYATSVLNVIGSVAYFNIPAKSPATTTVVRTWDTQTPATLPVTVLTRTASDITSFLLEGTTKYWIERVGPASTIWKATAAAAPEQVGSAHVGGGTLARGGNFIFASFGSEGKVVRFETTGGAAPLEILTKRRTPTSLYADAS
jgi:hypothetical protein